MRASDVARDGAMTPAGADGDTVHALDEATRLIVRLAATIAVADEPTIRARLSEAEGSAPADWIEEVILQSYLFAGFPRALNASREWRRISGLSAPETDSGERYEDHPAWRARGEETCETVYGPF